MVGRFKNESRIMNKLSFFILELKSRNESLFWFSMLLLALAVVFYALTKISQQQIDGVNVWYKPFKFALSIALFCSSMAWFAYELKSFPHQAFTWAWILLFTFEMVYIIVQAARGQASHFNVSTPVYSMLFGLMAVAAILITLSAAYVGLQYCIQELSHLPVAYVWAIRLGIFIFVVFAFEGMLMGSRLSHSVGVNGTQVLPLFKWNMSAGDLRVAHFIGMHALQILPLLAWFLVQNKYAILVLGLIYFLLAGFVLWQALQAKPFISSKQSVYDLVE